jgi:glycosyltransferase involved in cell wall biosynthesis
MKILTTLTYYLPHQTGLTLYCQRLSEHLVRRGHEVTVFTARYQKYLQPEEVINGVKVIRLSTLLRISRGMIMPSYPFALIREIPKYDLIHIHSPILELPLITLISRYYKKPVVITHHGDLILPKSPLNSFIGSMVFRLFTLSVPFTSRLVGYSKDYAAHSRYLSRFPDKVTVIYPPVFIPSPTNANAIRMRKELGLEGLTIIGYAGRFVEEKRPDYLITAIPYLTQKISPFKIVFAGEYLIKYEKYFQKCKSLIDQYQEHIKFTGLIRDPQELASFYALCDVLVLPSDTECLGLVQVEAMLCGTPVVVTDIPGAREAVRVTGMGRIAPRNDPKALAQVIADVVQRRNDYIKDPESIRAVFNLEHTVESYEKLFQECLSIRKSSLR